MNIGFVWDDNTTEANGSITSVDRAVNSKSRAAKPIASVTMSLLRENLKFVFYLKRKFLTMLHGQIKKHFFRFTKALTNVSLNNSGSFKYDRASLSPIGFGGVYQNPEVVEV